MREYLTYLATQVTNREVFFLNFGSDFRAFEILLRDLRSAWSRLGSERDLSGRSHVGLLPFANILVRHTLIGFQHITSYQSFLAWLTFRPGLEALLMIGKFLDDPANAKIWKDRQTDRKAYRNTFEGSALESHSLTNSADFRRVLSRLNDEFMHPNPDFAFRDATQTAENNAVLLDMQFFDMRAELHEAHVLAYMNLIERVVSASEDLVRALCGSDPAASGIRQAYCKQERARATRLAAQNGSAKKVLEELGLWII
jgi:hypothetical protein